MKYIIMPLLRYFDFAGRSRRREFWFFFVPLAAILCFTVLIIASAGLGNQAETSATASKVLIGILLVAAIPTGAVMARRLHDQNRSGWFVLLGLVPLPAAIVMEGMGWGVANPMLGRGALIAFAIMLIVMCIKGTPGANRFGPDPRV